MAPSTTASVRPTAPPSYGKGPSTLLPQLEHEFAEGMRLFFEALAPVEMVTRVLESAGCGPEAVALRVALCSLEVAYQRLDTAVVRWERQETGGG
jgi:hypothetical protein